jgi:hypothetical protein
MVIFQYVFPAKIPVYIPRDYIKWFASILKVNRQINKEATAVLYEQTPFHATISASDIWLCGKDLSKTDGSPGYIRRIRKLHVVVAFHIDRTSCSDSTLYSLRHIVRKFVNSIGQDNADQRLYAPFLNELSVKITSVCLPGPDFDDLSSAVTFVFAPFQNLRRIARPTLELSSLTSVYATNSVRKKTFLEFEKQFETNLRQEPLKASDPVVISSCEALKRMSKRLTALEKFAALLHGPMINERTLPDEFFYSDNPSWERTVFGGFEHILQYARFLRENEENDGFDAIHKAIQQRWETHQAYQHQHTTKMIKEIAALGDGDGDGDGGANTVKEIFESVQDQGVAVGEFTDRRSWAGLDLDYSLPFANEDQELVERRDDTDRVYFSFNGQTKFRLKTPDLLKKLSKN